MPSKQTVGGSNPSGQANYKYSMNDDYDTDRLIIVSYAPGAGGKFLINSLGLGNNAVLQHQDLCNQQLDNNLSTIAKFQLLSSRLDNVTTKWDDLGLGCQMLFGKTTPKFGLAPEINPTEEPLVITETIKKVIEKNWYFFVVAHTPRHKQQLLTEWPNARTLNLYNKSYKFFDTYRTSKLQKYWKTVAGASWPADPPTTISELKNLPNHIQDELKNRFQNEIYKHGCLYFNDSVNDTDWNIDWFLDEEATISNIEKLYNHFGIENFSRDLICQYRAKWLSVLVKLKSL